MSEPVKRKRGAPPDRVTRGQAGAQEGFLRPEAVVLPDEALIPGANIISPAPNQFTHELTRVQPFHYAGAREGKPPDGVLPATTKVALLVYDGGTYCRVVDSQGLYVQVEYDSLRKLQPNSP